ncbi:hypothetical protein ZWY2020_000068 [Hordeum vulgare]|nr:hypothetical protein ZWY2020_000068 [Hordeum vulgare]
MGGGNRRRQGCGAATADGGAGEHGVRDAAAAAAGVGAVSARKRMPLQAILARPRPDPLQIRALFKASILPTKARCEVCTRGVKDGGAAAVFTAECSHSFHFPCIAAHARAAASGALCCPMLCNFVVSTSMQLMLMQYFVRVGQGRWYLMITKPQLQSFDAALWRRRGGPRRPRQEARRVGCDDLFALVEDYFDASLHTLDFLIALGRALLRARDTHLLLHLALQVQDPSIRHARVLDALRRFKADPLTDEFFATFQAAYRQQLAMLDRLR